MVTVANSRKRMHMKKYKGKKGVLPFWIKATERERDEIKIAAATARKPMAEWLREAVRCQMERDGLPFFTQAGNENTQ